MQVSESPATEGVQIHLTSAQMIYLGKALETAKLNFSSEVTGKQRRITL